MYQFEWANHPRWAQEATATHTELTSRLPREHVSAALLLHWEEHCVECAAPECFRTCPLYTRRADGNCARFAYGIYPNPNFTGLLDRGADLRFRHWGKLETAVFAGMLPLADLKRLDRWEVPFARAVHGASGVIDPGQRRRRLDNAWQVSRRALFRRISNTNQSPDDFVLECYSFHAYPFRLLLEEVVKGTTVLRHAIDITPGPNFVRLSAHAFFLPSPDDGFLPRLLLYPEDNKQPRLVFTWLDFVHYAESSGAESQPTRSQPAKKVKCVAWDLDNTLWTGTLVEDGGQGCHPRAEMLALVRTLDERGILQTVVSKNDHEAAWRRIEDLRIGEYFLHPAINWGSKSENLRQVAQKLNIGLDAVALVDDSDFERAQVQAALPMVRVYSDLEALSMPSRPEFDGPVTEVSGMRRQSYRQNIEREQASARFPGDYLSFLRSCELRIQLFEPSDEAQRKRCLELIQRSNQLNLSTRRYSNEEFNRLLNDPNVLCVAFDCSDRFGDYGIVGFASISVGSNVAVVHDFVLSCRIARKRVEHSFFRWLGVRLAGGQGIVRVAFRPTERNGPLAEVLTDLVFRPSSDGCLEMDAAQAHALEEVNVILDSVRRPLPPN